MSLLIGYVDLVRPSIGRQGFPRNDQVILRFQLPGDGLFVGIGIARGESQHEYGGLNIQIHYRPPRYLNDQGSILAIACSLAPGARGGIVLDTAASTANILRGTRTEAPVAPRINIADLRFGRSKFVATTTTEWQMRAWRTANVHRAARQRSGKGKPTE